MRVAHPNAESEQAVTDRLRVDIELFCNPG
jgi:hypothetical protein